MNRCPIALTIGLATMLTTSTNAMADSSGKSLSVMTYNLKYASYRGRNSWPVRRPVAKEMIEKYRPDVFGTQEGLYQQLKDMDADLPDYRWIGVGREGGSRGEFMAVFYRTERLEPLQFGHYWLSETPDQIGSQSWGSSLPRMVTWVKFRDLVTKKQFYFINTHFDHRSQNAREHSARLILERAKKLGDTLPIVLVGDFNARAGSNPVHKTLVEGDAFVDSWDTAEDRGPAYNTFGGYRAPREGGGRIDWILLRGPVKALKTEIVVFNKDGQYPSDHYPVVAEVECP